MKRKRIQRVLTIAVIISMFVTSIDVGILGKKVDAEETKKIISNPLLLNDNSGNIVKWDCIWFGSYPQSEITSSDEIYSELCDSKEWDTNNCVIYDGKKYKRINSSDRDYTSTDAGNYYKFNGKEYHYFIFEPIKWRVLETNNADTILISDKALDSRCYTSRVSENNNWENSEMRSWLNGYEGKCNITGIDYQNNNFYATAFDEYEKNVIKSTVLNQKGMYNIEGSSACSNNIYIPSYETIYGYKASSFGFIDSKSLQVEPTTYAWAKGAVKGGYGKCEWWFTNGSSGASKVGFYGKYWTATSDYAVTNGIRPMIKIDSLDLFSRYAGTVCSDGTCNEVKYDESQKNNSSIIEAVKKYSTDNEIFKKMLLAISEKDLPNDVKMQLMSSVCTQYGFDNVKEGIEYVQDASSAQRAYQTLINNEQYGSWQFGNYLNNTTEGKVARGLLYVDGMIFNGELKGWMDPGTYVENDYPGIKKYKTLLTSFIGKKSDELDVFSNVDSIIKNYDNMVKIKEIDDDVLLEKIMDAKTDEKKDALIKKLFAKEKLNDDGKTVTLSSDRFAKAFKIASVSFTFGSDAIEDVVAFFHTEEKIGLYQEYNKFFEEIIKAEDLPFELRAAAYSLEQEMESGYWEPFKKLILHGLKNADALQTAVGGEIKVEKGEFDNLLGEATETIELAAFCVNLLVDMGGVVKNAAYTNGYAFLTAHYANLLEESRVRFSNEQTEENAWDFYNKYNMLYCLRIEGEKTYLDLNSLSPDGISGWGGFLLKYAFNYEGKRELVGHNINYLEQYCKFELPSGVEVPEYCQYSQKAVLKCPVDVEVIDSSGNTVAYIKDGEESDITNTYGRFISQYKPYTKDYTKIIYLKDDEKYEYKIIGQEDGDVSLEMYDQNDMITSFTNVQIQKNDVIIVDNQESDIYIIDRGNDGTIDEIYELEKKTDNKLVLLQSLKLSSESLELEEGESYKLSCSIEPLNATNNHVLWYSLDNDIATVSDDGEIEAHKLGKTDVYCVSTSVDEDGNLLMKKCTIIVKGAQSTEEPSKTALPIPSAPSTVTPSSSSSPTPTETITPKPSVTSTPNPEQTSTPTPSVDASSQPNLTPTQQPNETSPIPSTPATVQPSMDPTVQPSAIVAPSQNTTVKTTPKPKISNRNNSDKNSSVKKKQIAMKGNTFVGSHGTALYKIIDTGKRNTVSYIRNLKKTRENVKIPSSIKYKGVNYKVTSIGKRAFYQNKKLKKIIFGKNIIQIGKKAFYRCNSLKVIKLNKKLSEIGDSAFSTCIKLQYVAIPKSVKWIGKRAFYGCKKLRYIWVKSNQLTNKRVGRDSFAKGYKKVRVKTSKKKWRSYAKAMILKGKLSLRATFVVEPVPLILKK